jgi:hypothetical protein
MKIVDIKDWASSVVRTITVTQDVAGLKYDLPVRQFNPVPGDSLRRSWSTRGVPHHYDCTNYAIEDMKEAGRNLEKFVDSSIGPSIDYYIDKSDSLLHQTYHMALKHSREAKVKTTIRIKSIRLLILLRFMKKDHLFGPSFASGSRFAWSRDPRGYAAARPWA